VVAVGKAETPEGGLDQKQEKKSALSEFVLRKSYQAMYGLDWVKCSLVGGTSIVPYIHFYLGVRPALDRKKCTICLKCVPVCPVGAIDMPEMKINSGLCMKVRCMKCADACPESAIRIIGRETGGISN
jgi:ferredoxin